MAYVEKAMACAMLLSILLFAIGCGILFFLLCFPPFHIAPQPQLAGIALIGTMVLSIIAFVIFQYVRQANKDFKAIRYIPPVTPNILPAEEILVRASQEPTKEQSSVLLRAAQNAETPAEELLRSASCQKDR